jgi:hypothetical protein
MAQTPEGKVKDAVKKELKARKIWFFMPAANGFGKVGVPDIICCADGKFLAIETKAPGKRNNTTPNQERCIEEIQLANGWAIVVDDVQQVRDFLNERHN